jgi:hypothetical protein
MTRASMTATATPALDGPAPPAEGAGAGPPDRRRERSARVAETVKAEAARTEGAFAGAGDKLFAAMDALSRLTGLCEDLAVELDSPDVKLATGALEAVAPQVAAVGREEGRRGELLRRLLDLVERISWGVDGAIYALRPAFIIAMNAKVEAARLGDDGVQFTGFADEINAAFHVARSSLTAVGRQMAALRSPLQVACKRETELAGRLAEALQDVPQRIAESIQAITARSASAVAAAAQISEESRKVSAGASDAVLALQVGDSARQRLEHVTFALELVEQVNAGGLDPAEGDALQAACWDLEAAQLADTAHALGADLRATVGALTTLAGAAENIAGLGRGLFSSGQSGSFLGQLAQSIGQAQSLFLQLEQVWGSADELVASVSHLASDLEGPIRAVVSAEKEVRRLALNAIVKSGRVGERGRALGVIAQQLEGCVDLTTEQTAAVVTQLGELAELAQELAASEGAGARASVVGASRSIDEAMGRLAQMGERVTEGLGRLRDDSAAIAELIQSTAGKLEQYQGVVAILDAAAARLQELSADLTCAARPSGEPAREALGRIFKVYTMAREREIHLAVLGAADAPAAPVAEACTLF